MVMIAMGWGAMVLAARAGIAVGQDRDDHELETISSVVHAVALTMMLATVLVAAVA